MTGAPGSKWSSVSKHIYYSKDVDHSDYSEDRTYFHDAPGSMQLMHLGAYFDPQMEFGDFFDRLDQYSKEDIEVELDKPFSGTGKRIVKSHSFSNHLSFIRKTWPECPIITVERSNDSCLGWWVKCGHFNITYPNYNYFKNFRSMNEHIANENFNILRFREERTYYRPLDNHQLAKLLGIAPIENKQVYSDNDISVSLFHGDVVNRARSGKDYE